MRGVFFSRESASRLPAARGWGGAQAAWIGPVSISGQRRDIFNTNGTSPPGKPGKYIGRSVLSGDRSSCFGAREAFPSGQGSWAARLTGGVEQGCLSQLLLARIFGYSARDRPRAALLRRVLAGTERESERERERARASASARARWRESGGRQAGRQGGVRQQEKTVGRQRWMAAGRAHSGLRRDFGLKWPENPLPYP